MTAAVPTVYVLVPFLIVDVVVAAGANGRFRTAGPEVPVAPAAVQIAILGVIVTSEFGVLQDTRTRFRKKLVAAAAVNRMKVSSVLAEELLVACT